ncbi:Transport protein particle [Wickerhamomyces ciferrii]|uniref:Transport protein particle n=1 Tax=Wickerhamomyces ciferrii (strain ATCC 14091 / BCRC 22168 / CBS 111 / JCM 3599 / NBRC 0793 / NRRL Y-1031 F-60-10) TaxID=1206466 RepID=K0KYJ5_WICCF|nr:Transport protein particle [Wickerhamomyces ciferrii]CCH47147.1 Transport protein particle [Wickerhamomyces ciferrii]
MDTEPQSLINSTCLDLLMNEIVPLAIRTTEEQSNPIDQPTNDESELIKKLDISPITAGGVEIFDSEYIQSEDVYYKVEQYGFSIGIRISEILIYKNSNNEILKNLELLNIMKFICRDVWKLIYGKQMDNLRTNHKGTFVLIDNSFKIFNNYDSPIDLNDTILKSKPYLYIPTGIIRGVLKSFGVESIVTPEITKFPSVSFNIQTS